MECWCSSCNRDTGSKTAVFCGLCISEKCAVDHPYCRHLWGWQLVWLMYGIGLFWGTAPAVPCCRHEAWHKRKHECCRAVADAVDARRDLKVCTVS